MSRRLKRRIKNALVSCLIISILFCFVYRFIWYRADWLTFSILWPLSWVTGWFISGSLTDLKRSLLFNVIAEILILVVAFNIGTFIFSVLCGFFNWEYWLSITYVPFGLGIIITSIINLFFED